MDSKKEDEDNLEKWKNQMPGGSGVKEMYKELMPLAKTIALTGGAKVIFGLMGKTKKIKGQITTTENFIRSRNWEEAQKSWDKANKMWAAIQNKAKQNPMVETLFEVIPIALQKQKEQIDKKQEII